MTRPLNEDQIKLLVEMTKDYFAFQTLSRKEGDAVAEFVKFVANHSGILTGDSKGRALGIHYRSCKNVCGIVVPYGFVPESGCPVHDIPDQWWWRLFQRLGLVRW